MEKGEYKAFISYSHADRKLARWLHRKLESFRPPGAMRSSPAPLNPVFRDEDELGAAPDLSERIRRALEASDNLIVIASPAAAASAWVDAEVRAFKATGNHRVFVLHTGDAALKSGLPPALLEGDAEPLAASTGSGEGRTGAFQRLVAGLLDLKLDELRRRDARRRNRRLFTITSMSVAAMLVAVSLATVAIINGRRAEEQRVRAELEAATARRVSDFLVDLISQVDPAEARGRQVTLREVFEIGSRRIDRELATEPELRRRLLQTFGNVYVSLGLYETAIAKLKESVEMARAHGDPGILAAGLLDLASAYQLDDRLKMAEDTAEEALAVLSAAPQPDVLATAAAEHQLGMIVGDKGQYDEALALLEASLATRRRTVGPLDPLVAESHVAIAQVHQMREENAAARSSLEQAYAVRQQALGLDHPDTVTSLCNLAQNFAQLGDPDAIPMFEDCLARQETLLGSEHPRIARTLNNLAIAVFAVDRAAARGLFERSLQVRLAALGERHADVAESYNNLAYVDFLAGDYEAAARGLNAALAVWEAALGPEHPVTSEALNNLAETYLALGRPQDGEPLIRRAVEIRDAGPVPTTELANSLKILGQILAATDRRGEAAAAYERALAIFLERQAAGFELTDLIAELESLRKAL